MSGVLQNKKRFIVVDDLVLELKYEINPPYSLGSSAPEEGPQIYIANLHHGHSKIENAWGELIKNSTKLTTESKKGMGLKLLAWSVLNLKTIFPGYSIEPKYWSGNFQAGIEFWSKTTLWDELKNETYIDNSSMIEWANSIEKIEDETSIKIYDSMGFL